MTARREVAPFFSNMNAIRSVMWKSLFQPGHEWFRLLSGEAGCKFLGTVVVSLGGKTPALIRYEIDCDRHWQTRRVQVEQQTASDTRQLELECSGELKWFVNGRYEALLDGCQDVDIAASPSTNTLPIRRLGLAVGASAPVSAAWVRFPSLEVAVLEQSYGRLDEARYLYESRPSFQAELTVDDLGLVVTYAGGWERC